MSRIQIANRRFVVWDHCPDQTRWTGRFCSFIVPSHRTGRWSHPAKGKTKRLILIMLNAVSLGIARLMI